MENMVSGVLMFVFGLATGLLVALAYHSIVVDMKKERDRFIIAVCLMVVSVVAIIAFSMITVMVIMAWAIAYVMGCAAGTATSLAFLKKEREKRVVAF